MYVSIVGMTGKTESESEVETETEETESEAETKMDVPNTVTNRQVLLVRLDLCFLFCNHLSRSLH